MRPFHPHHHSKMKRKISDDPPHLRSPSGRGAHRSSGSRIPITTPPTTTDISSKKGVKFTNHDRDETRRHQISESGDNAKTSEYAFFKKLKEDAIRNHHACSRNKEAFRERISKPRDSSRERVDLVQNRSEDVRSSAVNKDATPNNFESSQSLPGSASRKSGINMKRPCTTLEDVHGKHNSTRKESKNASRQKGKQVKYFEETETEYRHADVFDLKRQKLHHWVTETSFPEIDDLCSKGYNFASLLLSRLIPKSNENNNVKNPKLIQRVNDKSIPLPNFESGIPFKELQWSPTRNFMELEDGPNLDDTSLSCWSRRSKETVFCSEFPISHAYKKQHQYTVWEPDSELLGGSAISCSNSDSYDTDTLPFKEYGLMTSSRVKEPDLSFQLHEYMVGRELCAPMLGWNVIPFEKYGLMPPSHLNELDVFSQPTGYMIGRELCSRDFDSTDRGRNLPGLSRYRADSELLGCSTNLCAMSDSGSVLPFEEYGSRASRHVKELDQFCQPNEYLFRRDPCALMLGWDFDSVDDKRNSLNPSRSRDENISALVPSYPNCDVERQCLEGNDDIGLDFHQTENPLAITCVPTLTNQAEGCVNDRAWEGGTAFFPLHQNHWFAHTIINEGLHYLNPGSLLPSSDSSIEAFSSTCHALQFPRDEGRSSHLLTYGDEYERCLDDSSPNRTLTHFIEDNVGNDNSSALSLQLSSGREKTWPLAVDIDVDHGLDWK